MFRNKKYTACVLISVFSIAFCIIFLSKHRTNLSTYPNTNCLENYSEEEEHSSGNENVEYQARQSKKRKDLNKLILKVKTYLIELRGASRESSQSNVRIGYQRSLIKEIRKLDIELGLREYRQNLSKSIAEKIHTRLYNLQNPKDCKKAKILYCDLVNPAGLASGVHDFLWCFVKAYFTGSMVSMTTNRWHYSPRGWETIFKPLSQNCGSQIPKKKLSAYPGVNGPDRRNPIASLPSDLAKELLKLGRNPMPFWYGQILGFALKPNKDVEKIITNTIKNLGFKSPIVGVHIRRTDKVGSEAIAIQVDEYMSEVEDYYEQLIHFDGVKLQERLVYLATDDPSVYEECKKRYPGYRFLFNSQTSLLANKGTTRYNEESTTGAIVDMFILARTDYIVCTFSSGYGRLAYELMQYFKPDAMDKVYSLDNEFHYAGALNPKEKAWKDYISTKKGEMTVSKGDIIQQTDELSFKRSALAGIKHDGFSEGINFRTKEVGKYPSYITKPVFDITEVFVEKK